jgi:hypothetical protein
MSHRFQGEPFDWQFSISSLAINELLIDVTTQAVARTSEREDEHIKMDD